MNHSYPPPTRAQQRNWRILQAIGIIIVCVVTGYIVQYRQALQKYSDLRRSGLDRVLASEDLREMLTDPFGIVFLALNGAAALLALLVIGAIAYKLWTTFKDI